VSSLREPIAAAWGANQSLIPAHVARVINLSSRLPSSSRSHILVDGFFGPGLKSESSAQVAGFFEFSQSPSASVMGALRSLFVASSDFVNSLPFPDNSPVWLSAEQAQRFSISDEVQLVSGLDLAVARGGAVELPERFDLQRTGKRIGHPVSFPVRLTALGRLLGELDPIPTFSSENLPLCSVESFLYDLSVGFGRSDTIFIRFESLEEVRSSGILSTADSLRVGLQNCFVPQTEGHNLATLAADFKGSLYRIRRASMASCESTNLFLSLNFFASSRAGSADLVSFLRQIRGSPDAKIGFQVQEFLEQFLSLPSGMFDPPVALAFAPHGENFEAFRKMNPHLSVYDERVREALGDRDRVNRFIRKSERGLLESLWAKRRFRELRSAHGILGHVRDAALERTAYLKEIEFSRAFGELQEFFNVVAPPETSWGADEWVPLTIMCLVEANPPYFVSNVAFLQMCGPTDAIMGLGSYMKWTLESFAGDEYKKVAGDIHCVPPPTEAFCDLQ
jgi:hypothetical protein